MNTNEKLFSKVTSNFYDPMANRLTGYVVTEEIARGLAFRLENRSLQYQDEIPDEDIYNIFVGVNIWCNLFADMTGKDPRFLLNRIMLTGLQGGIAEADNHRLWLISAGNRGKESSFWSNYVNQEQLFGVKRSNRNLTHSRFAQLFSDALTLTGCLRRIRLSCLDYSFMIEEFLASNRKCGSFNARGWIDFGELDNQQIAFYRSAGSIIPNSRPTLDQFQQETSTCGSRILEDLAEIVAIILKDYERDYNLFSLPPGSTYEGAKTYLEKFKIVEAESGWLAKNGIDIRSYCDLPREECTDEFGFVKEPANCNRYITVPKSYKTGRGVAPEPVSRQVLGYQVAAGIERCLKSFGVDLHDQEINRVACRLAHELHLTTVDYSAASDSISLELVKTLFKYVPEVLRDLLLCRTGYIEIRTNGRTKQYVNHRAFTMGNAVTFAVESLIFFALAIYCTSLTDLFSRKEGKKSHITLQRSVEIYNIHVYGDDVLIPDEAYPLYCELSSKLGFTVNLEKSYSGADPYRESCGVECWKTSSWKKSVDVTGVYYPRGTSRKALPELLGLQHKYWRFPSVNNFLIGLILDVYPKMTTTEISDANNSFDIWVDTPIDTPLRSISDCYTTILYCWRVSFDLTVKEVNKKYALTSAVRERRNEKAFFLTTRADVREAAEKLIGMLNDIYFLKGNVEDISKIDIRYLGTRYVDQTSDVRAEITEFYPEFLGEKHAVIDSKSSISKIPEDEADRVERLMYLLTLGRGVDHINSSDYTEPEKMVRDRRDLLGDRKITVTLKTIM